MGDHSIEITLQEKTIHRSTFRLGGSAQIVVTVKDPDGRKIVCSKVDVSEEEDRRIIAARKALQENNIVAALAALNADQDHA